MRELCVKQKTATGNQLTSLLLEFNIKVTSRNGGLKGVIESTLEDAENGFSFEFRKALSTAWQQYLSVINSIHTYDECLECAIASHTDCKKLRQGVGTLNAINLYIALGCADLGVFNKGKDASACIGLTPIQYSSGGVTKLGSIGKYVKSSVLRSQLITGAMSAVNHATRRKERPMDTSNG